MGSNGRSNNGHGQPLYATRIDLPADIRAQVIASLNNTLAATLDLKTQVKQAHWNVKGLQFYQLHELFDEMASELEAYVDMVAERVTALGGLALGTARIAAAQSILPEYPLDILDGKDHVVALAERYAAYAKLVRDGIQSTDDLGDADTADLYTEVSRDIDKRLWFLEAHLQTGEAIVAMVQPEEDAAEPAKAKKTTKRTK
ncbi:MAG: DNA starvation/stationary phase protection protein Dps [Cyanobacteria bacterium J069]|nr:MAG: DNA starvation/stationary phase protection protein Dps [Cyanobacteria bacterium J069]